MLAATATAMTSMLRCRLILTATWSLALSLLSMRDICRVEPRAGSRRRTQPTAGQRSCPLAGARGLCKRLQPRGKRARRPHPWCGGRGKCSGAQRRDASGGRHRTRSGSKQGSVQAAGARGISAGQVRPVQAYTHSCMLSQAHTNMLVLRLAVMIRREVSASTVLEAAGKTAL